MIIKRDIDMIKGYFEDSSNLKGGFADAVVIPENSSELAAFLKEANLKSTPVTISGGGTSTTGSRIPFGGVILSMEKLNRISDISDDRMSASVQAGVLVDELKTAAEKRGLFYTSHPTERMALVGGTVATNASGARSFKYGPTRKYVRRLKMVLADGMEFEIFRGQTFLSGENCKIKISSDKEISIPMPHYKIPGVKSSAGYYAKDGMDLIDLFIGQEGTLSVITEVEMGLVKKPEAILSAFVFFKEEKDAWNFSEDAKKNNGLNLLSIEYFDHNAVELLRLKDSNVPHGASSAIFLEQDASRGAGDKALNILTRMIGRHNTSLELTWVAMNEKEAERFTSLRYAIPESLNEIIKKNGFRKFSTDIAVPSGKLLEMMNFYVDTFKRESLNYVIFGHIGENHLHVNILPRSKSELVRAEELSLSFIRKGISLGGSVAAEHGIGKLKHKYLEEMYGSEGVAEMVKIKKVFDPNGILGLDNIFPREKLA